MSSTPIFDQMIAEYPLELRYASHIFPVPTTQVYFRKKREESMAQHPSQGPKPMITPPGTKFFMGFDPAGDPTDIIAEVDEFGRLVKMVPPEPND